MSETTDLEVKFRPKGRGGKGTLVAILNGSPVHADEVTVTDADDRERFERALCDDRPGIDAGAVREELLTIAASLADGADDDDPNQAALLVELAADAELFHTAEGEAFATVPVDAHRETYLVNGRTFKLWLQRRFYEAFGKPPGSQAMQAGLGILTGKAIYDGEEHRTAVRLGRHGDAIYLDLADPEWRAVRIAADGFQVVNDPPVKFIRRKGMLPLPAPVAGGSVDELRRFVNVPDDDDWVLVKAWVLGSLCPDSKYPILAINGEHGCGKTGLCRMLRALVDPNHADLRSSPRDERDLMIAAANSWMVAFDNLSVIPGPLSDALCRLATGGGFATRELFTDGDEKLFNATRPILFNGIEELGTRPDLLSRVIAVALPAIPAGKRKLESDLWPAFEEARPRILGAFLTALSVALRNRPAVKLPDPPRMADFAALVVAGEAALGIEAGGFVAAYTGNREAANDLAIEASAVGPALLGLMHTRGQWDGTAKELLTELADHHADEKTRNRSDWPENPKAMSGALRRLAPNLRQSGVTVELPDDRKRVGKGRRRVITLRRAA